MDTNIKAIECQNSAQFDRKREEIRGLFGNHVSCKFFKLRKCSGGDGFLGIHKNGDTAIFTWTAVENTVDARWIQVTVHCDGEYYVLYLHFQQNYYWHWNSDESQVTLEEYQSQTQDTHEILNSRENWFINKQDNECFLFSPYSNKEICLHLSENDRIQMINLELNYN